MSFVVLNPHSNTNPTDKYWVVEHSHWNQCVNSGHIDRITHNGDFDNYRDADEHCRTLNFNASTNPPNDPLWDSMDN
ncbi:hypothetical protein [Nocardia vulneris]|uniref:hypothetical protein n=1 Tax=Nocardia vulneris TaxID=1141657 RepID=UPI000A3E3B49|nr:hypothetical protein [Nocardia vulneris]